MILLPLMPDPVSTPVPMPRKAHEQVVLKVLVLGFTPPEQKLLEGVVALSKRRSPCLELLGADAAADADAIMIDTNDARAMAWASQQVDLQSKTVIWVDGRSAAGGHTLIKRPVAWPSLPALLHQALEHGPR